MLQLDKISRVWNQFVNHGKMDNIIYSNFKNVIVFPLNTTFIVVEDRESSQCTNEMSQVYNNIFLCETEGGYFIPIFLYKHKFVRNIKKYQLKTVRVPGSSGGKEFACNAGHPGSTPGLGRFPGEENGNPVHIGLSG